MFSSSTVVNAILARLENECGFKVRKENECYLKLIVEEVLKEVEKNMPDE